MKLTKLLILCTLLLFCINAYGNDIHGEARIIENNGLNYLINYDREYEIASDGSFELNSSSYVYLTVEADNVQIKSIYTAGHLTITGNRAGKTLFIGSDGNLPETAIRCGNLDIDNYINLNIQASDTGIKSEGQVEIKGGNMNVSAANGNGIMTRAFFSARNGAIITSSGIKGMDIGTKLLADTRAQLTGIGSETGIECKGMVINKESKVTGNELTTDGNHGIVVRESGNIIINSGSTLYGRGSDCGIRLEGGYIRGQSSFIEGKRQGVDGVYTAVFTEGDKIFSTDGGMVRETYEVTNMAFDENTLLTDYPLLAKNITNAEHYEWGETETGIIGSRKKDKMYPAEKVKIDSYSHHEVIFQGSTGGSEKIIEINLCGSLEDIHERASFVFGNISIESEGITLSDLLELGTVKVTLILSDSRSMASLTSDGSFFGMTRALWGREAVKAEFSFDFHDEAMQDKYRINICNPVFTRVIPNH